MHYYSFLHLFAYLWQIFHCYFLRQNRKSILFLLIIGFSLFFLLYFSLHSGHFLFELFAIDVVKSGGLQLLNVLLFVAIHGLLLGVDEIGHLRRGDLGVELLIDEGKGGD